MEFFDPDFTQQLAPLVAVTIDPLHKLESFKRHLEDANVTGKVWDDVIIKNRLLKSKYCFHFEASEKTILASVASYKNKARDLTKHSIISPFNIESDLFPNGILSNKWFAKYTRHLPAAVICSYYLPESAADDEALGLQLTMRRENYQTFDVKFIAIVVSDTDDALMINRISQLRQISGLPRSLGLFHISLDSISSITPVFERDCEILATTILSTLKSICTDFYTAIEHRIEQRSKKYYTLPDPGLVDTQISVDPRFLEVRNKAKQCILAQLMHPHNVEGSLSIIESTYAELLSLVAEFRPVFTSPNVSSHDKALHTQWRTLLDVLVLHLVRGYFSIEEPIAALRKHDAHVRNITEFAGQDFDYNVWLARQYHWLAELLSQVPKSILDDLYSSVVKTPNAKGSLYFGGMSFHDANSCNIVTSPSLLYAKAARCLDIDQINVSIQNYKVSLLKTASRILSQKEGGLEYFEAYLNWQLADELSRMDKTLEAESAYSTALASKHLSSDLALLIEKQRLRNLQKIHDSENFASSIIQIAIKDPGTVISADLTKLLGKTIVSPELPPIFEVDALLFAEQEETFVLSTVVNQLKVTPQNWFKLHKLGGFHFNDFDNLSLKVYYEDGLDFSLSSSGTQGDKLQILPAGLSCFNASGLRLDLVILQYDRVPKVSGWYGVAKIDISLRLHFSQDDVEIICEHSESHSFSEFKRLFSSFIYEQATDGLKSKALLLRGRPGTKIMVKPYKPDLSASFKQISGSIIMEEKLSIPVEFSRSRLLASDIVFKELVVEVKSAVYEDDLESADFYVQHNWDSLKDDKPLDLLKFAYSQDQLTHNILHVSIKRSPSLPAKPVGTLKAEFRLRLTITEQSDLVSTFELGYTHLIVLTEPFGTDLQLMAQRLNSLNLMPNPFILSLGADDYSMPQPARLWLAKISLQDDHNLLNTGGIEIVSAEFQIKTKNTELVIKPDGPINRENEYFTQLYSVRSKTHITQSKTPVFVNCSILWKRAGIEKTHSLTSQELEFIVPVQEPRVTLDVHSFDDHSMQFEYILENPTPRILTFATNFLTDRAALRGTDWTFEANENMIPLKQAPFPVLPFSEHRISYSGSYTRHGLQPTLDLPHLQVQDMNYKVELKITPLQDHVKEIEQSMVYQLV